VTSAAIGIQVSWSGFADSPVTAGVVNRRLEIIEQVFLVAQGPITPPRGILHLQRGETRRITTSMPMPMPTPMPTGDQAEGHDQVE
jgi:hypothetical protein